MYRGWSMIDSCSHILLTYTSKIKFIQRKESEMVYKVNVSFIEIYKEDTIDLISNSSKNILIGEDKFGNTVLFGACKEPVYNAEDVLNLLDAGTAMRHVSATSINGLSSRSHCIFSLILEQYPVSNDNLEKGAILFSQFNFVDLAGSERIHCTGSHGECFNESVFINSGLLALGNVISALSDNKKNIPYRESKLTCLLKDSLGGNSRTLMITCLSPALSDLDEDINSLKYATRAKLIRNKPVSNWLKHSQTNIPNQLLQSENKGTSNENKNDLKFSNNVLQDHKCFIQSFNEISTILRDVKLCNIPNDVKEKINMWLGQWDKSSKFTNICDPSTTIDLAMESFRGGLLEIDEKKRECIDCEKTSLNLKHILCMQKNELEEMRTEVNMFGEENAILRLELDKMKNKNAELQEYILEKEMNNQKVNIQGHAEVALETSNQLLSEERVLQKLCAINSMRISQMDDADFVEHDDDIDDDVDDDISSEEQEESIITHEASISQTKKYLSNIPRPIKYLKNQNTPTPTKFQPNNMYINLEKGKNLGIKESEKHQKEFLSEMKMLEHNIRQKELLINELLLSEKEAKETSVVYKEKLDKLEIDYNIANDELLKVKQKIDEVISLDDDKHKKKLENDYNKKLLILEKKFATLKKKESAYDRFMDIQSTKEKKIKELESSMVRMKNQYIEIERHLKSELERVNDIEFERRKSELRIKELEKETNQQKKILKIKNEEVAAAQRKLRTSSGGNMTSRHSELEKKQVWLDAEIEKIITKQKEMNLLEAELVERDVSLRKKELLLSEKKELEVKKFESNQELSNSLLRLSIQMETIDEQIQKISPSDTNHLHQLTSMKEDLIQQKLALEHSAHDFNGLDAAEQRRLIELSEALDAVDEAIKYKNNLIKKNQANIESIEYQNYIKVEYLIKNMGDLNVDEYKHLLGKLFLKIINLRKILMETETMKQQFDIKVNSQSKTIHQLERTIKLIESRYENLIIEQNCKHENEVHFFMEQLKNTEKDIRVKDTNMRIAQETEKRNKYLEKELYYYKVQAKRYKSQLKEMVSIVPNDSDLKKNSRDTENSDKFRLPPVQDAVFSKERNERRCLDEKRLSEIFEMKPANNLSSNRLIQKSRDSLGFVRDSL
ncbi:kinesin-like protein kif7 isoform X6 [Hydra vulgaris]|uniref:Kinesin-like protein kif7 isoform X6 n=1 Tax=Hydra vulgaris TaxID=6087 RepID=A0ABM4CK25_HYDVU